jgi:arginine/lysine/ornithine decarboxylase
MLDQTQTPLLTALSQCSHRPHAAFYTPGHKRGQGISPVLRDLLGAQVFRADLPEIPGLDNLFAPDSVILAAQELAADAFGADQTWFVTNGSTCGVMAAIVATCRPGDRIILPRNLHSSAISGLIAAGAHPVFVQPEYDGDQDLVHTLTPAAVEAALTRYPEAKAVLMVSPTYEGICGPVGAIATLAHAHGIPLVVDEAHGPHFGFHPDLPISALAAGADLSVQSTHKVLAALTQAAMVHVQGNFIDRTRLTQALHLFQSTSPSYLLLASLDAARQQMAVEGKTLLERTLHLAEQARQRLRQLSGISVLEGDVVPASPGFYDLDRTRLTLGVSDLELDGFALDHHLNQTWGVIAELPTHRHLTFIISLGNTQADIDQLIEAWHQITQSYPRSTLTRSPLFYACGEQLSTPVLSPREAFLSEPEVVPQGQAIGRVSAELVCPYPPGIPLLLPGELITATALEQLAQIWAEGGTLTGCSDSSLQTLRVVRQ